MRGYESVLSREKHNILKLQEKITAKIKYLVNYGLFKDLELIDENPINIRNAKGSLIDAIYSGKIVYDYKKNGINIEKAPAYIQEELIDTYDKLIDHRSNIMYISFVELTQEHRAAFDSIKVANMQKAKDIIGIAALSLTFFVSKDYKSLFASDVNSIVDLTNKAFQQNKLNETLSTFDYEALKNQYLESIDTKIKGMAQDAVQNLREKVVQNIYQNQSPNIIKQTLMKQKGITEERSAMIARQETQAALSGLETLKYNSIGITKFKWLHPFQNRETSRPFHVFLSKQSEEGVLFDSTHPPTDPDTGESAMPGTLPNCHCIALWVK